MKSDFCCMNETTAIEGYQCIPGFMDIGRFKPGTPGIPQARTEQWTPPDVICNPWHTRLTRNIWVDEKFNQGLSSFELQCSAFYRFHLNNVFD